MDYSILKPGDIILSTTDSIFSRLIRWYIGSDYSHSSIYIGNGKIVHSIALKGVSIADISLLSDFAVYRYVGLTLTQQNAVRSFCMANIGKKYDWYHILVLAYRILFGKIEEYGGDYCPERYVCLELVTQAYLSIGVGFYSVSDNVLPQHIANHNKTVKIA